MDLAAIRLGIAECLDGAGLTPRHYETGRLEPDTALIRFADPVTYHKVLGRMAEMTVIVHLTFGAADAETANRNLDSALSDTGPDSIVVILNAAAKTRSEWRDLTITQAVGATMEPLGDTGDNFVATADLVLTIQA